MDRYLCKAKRLDNAKWEKGYYAKCRGHQYILPVYDEDHGFDERYAEWFEVIQSTVCRYTELTDKNNQKIWENDIVYVTDDEGYSGQVDTGVGEIDFLEGIWYVSGDVQNGLYDIGKCMVLEVIGNIFDNPELLNSQNCHRLEQIQTENEDFEGEV